MPRPKLIRTAEHPYHITTRSNNKEWFYIPTSDVWNHAYSILKNSEKKFNVKVDAFVVMNNHYHLCVYTPEANVDKFMNDFNLKLSKKISRQADRINRIFGARYHWSVIETNSYYFNVIRYIYQNPVRAEICQRCEDYPFSDLVFQDYSEEEMAWINTAQNSFDVEITKKKLKKFVI